MWERMEEGEEYGESSEVDKDERREREGEELELGNEQEYMTGR